MNTQTQIEIARQFCIKGDKETNDAVRDALERGLIYAIKTNYLRHIKGLIKDWSKESNLIFLQHKIKKQIEYLGKNYAWYEKQKKLGTPYWFYSMCSERIVEGEKELERLIKKEKFLVAGHLGIGYTSINNAKNYPIEDIIELDKRGFALKNPLREEKTSSFYCKNNFWHDFGNGETGDVIDLVMRMYKMSFKQAIEKLNLK